MDRILSKYINTGDRVSTSSLRTDIINAFHKMGHEVVEVDVFYIGFFATARSRGEKRHHYQMRSHIRINNKR